MCVCVCVYIHIHGGLVAKLCQTLGIPWTVSLPGSSIDGIFQARILKWIAISFSVCVYIHIYIHTKILNIQGTLVGPYNNTCHHKKVNAKLGVFQTIHAHFRKACKLT